jgi:hypothetical protein
MGEWIEIQRAWYETTVTNCVLCGRLIPRRIWRVDIDNRALDFCGPDCEQWYRDYWIPRYGEGSATS